MSDDKDDVDLTGAIKEKLIRSKEKWAEQGRLLTGRPDLGHVDRLPPGQKLVTNWPVLDLGVQPDIKLQNWRLRIGGLVENPVAFTIDEFTDLLHEDSVSDIHCVTSWSRFDNRWRGVPSKVVLDLVRPKSGARHVVFHAYDGYTTNLKLAAFSDANVMLADSWEGQPIPREHGGPVRAVVPDWYFWKSAKWVNRIEFVAEDRPGFWEIRGYHNEGDPWKEERYS